MLKAVHFDVDGTLVDSVDIHAEAWREAFHGFVHEPRFEDIRSQIGKGGDQLIPVFMSKDEVNAHGAALEAHRSDILKSRYLSKIKGFPDVRELFQRLQTHDIQIVLASSAKGEELEFYKKQAGIEDPVKTQTLSDDAEKSKSYPDVFQAAKERLQGLQAATLLSLEIPPTMQKPQRRPDCEPSAFYVEVSRSTICVRLDASRSIGRLPISSRTAQPPLG